MFPLLYSEVSKLRHMTPVIQRECNEGDYVSIVGPTGKSSYQKKRIHLERAERANDLEDVVKLHGLR